MMINKNCKRLLAMIFSLMLLADAKADTRLMKDLDVWDVWTGNYNASHWIEQGNIHEGLQMYGENQQIAISRVPKFLQGADWIQTGYGSRSFSGDKLATFCLKGDAEVYIAHNQLILKIPLWLKGYTRSNESIANSRGEVFSLYKKVYHKGDTVTLGTNGSTDQSMYIVIVKSIGALPEISFPRGKIFDVLKYGAIGDNKTINTDAIQKSIDECSNSGGGSVYIHNGIFVTGTLELKDNVTLFVASGSILRGSSSHADYPQKICSFKFFRANEHYQLIYAEKKKNIAITGGGIIDGFSHGDGWPWEGKSNEFERPRLIRMVECENIKTQNITLIRPANWTQLYEGCNNLLVKDIRIRAYTGQHNQDGIDISSCNGVVIKNFYSLSGDDAICLKAMSVKPTENVFVDGLLARYANCHAVKIGTETHGQVKNIHVKNVIANARYGIAIESVDGSDLDHITYENFLLTSCSTPLFIRLGERGRTYEGGPVKASPGSMKNIIIRNIKNTGIGYVEDRNGPGVGSAIGGLPDRKIENLLIENCDFLYYGSIQDTAFVYRDVPENRDKYPEFNIYGTCPAYGLYARHVKDLTIRNVRIRAENSDVRPAVVLDDVDHYKLDDVLGEKFPGTEPSVFWHRQRGNLASAPPDLNKKFQVLKSVSR